jgi:hypothetical protein
MDLSALVFWPADLSIGKAYTCADSLFGLRRDPGSQLCDGTDDVSQDVEVTVEF